MATVDIVRKDTLTLVFGPECGRNGPSNGELCKWMLSELKLSVSDLVSVEHEHGSRRVYMRMKCSEKLAEVVSVNAGERKFKMDDGRVAAVTLSGGGLGVKWIKVRNLPTEMEPGKLREELSRYGKVFEVVYEKYGQRSVFEGLLTGARVVKIALKRHVPSYVTVCGINAYVKYWGQPDTCRACGAEGHFASNPECPNRSQRGGDSYASRAAGRPQPAEPVVNKQAASEKRKEEGRRMVGRSEGESVVEDVVVVDYDSVPHSSHETESGASCGQQVAPSAVNAVNLATGAGQETSKGADDVAARDVGSSAAPSVVSEINLEDSEQKTGGGEESDSEWEDDDEDYGMSIFTEEVVVLNAQQNPAVATVQKPRWKVPSHMTVADYVDLLAVCPGKGEKGEGTEGEEPSQARRYSESDVYQQVEHHGTEELEEMERRRRECLPRNGWFPDQLSIPREPTDASLWPATASAKASREGEVEEEETEGQGGWKVKQAKKQKPKPKPQPEEKGGKQAKGKKQMNASKGSRPTGAPTKLPSRLTVKQQALKDLRDMERRGVVTMTRSTSLKRNNSSPGDPATERGRQRARWQ